MHRSQWYPSVTGLYDGGFTVTWQSYLQDGGGFGVYGQRFGSPGIVTRRGTDGDDTLTGGDGKDRLVGLAGADVLDGGAGNDRLTGGAGADTLDGGLGIDRAIYRASDAGVSVNLTTGTGRGGDAQGDRLMRIEHLTGSAFNDSLTGDDGDNRLDGGAGADRLTGGAGADTLNGGAGNDRAFYMGSNAAVKVNLADSNAEQGGHAAGDRLMRIEHLTGSAFNDTLTGDDGDNHLDGGLGADMLNGGAGADTLTGGADADALTGGAGNDVFIGGAGRDTLDGGSGNDWLEGGAGADVFVFNPDDGVVGDTIADFRDGMDSIRILGSVSFDNLTIADSGGDAVVTWDGNALTFQGLDRTLLTADDFTFV